MNSYERLAEAIVTRAVHDYNEATRRKNHEAVKRLERFFRSDYFCLLINLDGEDILKMMRRKYA
jgi:hypothetical protein